MKYRSWLSPLSTRKYSETRTNNHSSTRTTVTRTHPRGKGVAQRKRTSEQVGRGRGGRAKEGNSSFNQAYHHLESRKSQASVKSSESSEVTSEKNRFSGKRSTESRAYFIDRKRIVEPFLKGEKREEISVSNTKIPLEGRSCFIDFFLFQSLTLCNEGINLNLLKFASV